VQEEEKEEEEEEKEEEEEEAEEEIQKMNARHLSSTARLSAITFCPSMSNSDSYWCFPRAHFPPHLAPSSPARSNQVPVALPVLAARARPGRLCRVFLDPPLHPTAACSPPRRDYSGAVASAQARSAQ
jgi:hypothetical protein